MDNQETQQFSNRWGIVLASLGMAIGAGNLWRFPRLAGQYGGSFIILWILFLFVWSIPLLLAEFSIGKKIRKGVIGSYGQLVGKRYTFLGFFVALCTLGIAFYYAVVTAWAFRYFGISLSNLFASEKAITSPETLHEQWMSISNGSGFTLFVFVLVVLAAAAVLSKGISKGLEKANKLLIPSLFVILLIICAVSLSMEGGILGLEYMFSIDPSLFAEPKIWIEAVSQSAWSTGAGWGLLMTLSSYSRKNEDVVLNTFIGAFGNNTASLLAGMAILPAVFALSASEADALSYLQSGSQALTFNVIPQLFANIPGGQVIALVFFLALFIAAFTSLLPMMELLISHVVRIGIVRKRAIYTVVVLFLIFGFPSAYNLNVFTNQDWVWGLGLILSGMFIAFAIAKYNPIRFKIDFVEGDSDISIYDWYFQFCSYLILAIGAGLVYWWMSRGYSDFPWLSESGNWNVLDVYSNASVITQWSLVLVLGALLNAFLYKKFVKK